MKKYVSLLMAMVLCLLMAVPMAAAEPPAPRMVTIYADEIGGLLDSGGIAPFWLETSTVTHGVSISGSTATATVQWKTYTTTCKIDLTVTLQRKSGSSFVTQAGPWTKSGTGVVNFSQTASVGSGTYRLKTVGQVYDSSGRHIETVELYSTEKTC